MDGLRMGPATAVTAPLDQPEPRGLREHLGDIARQEVGHLVDGCAATKALPQIVQVHGGPWLPRVHVHLVHQPEQYRFERDKDRQVPSVLIGTALGTLAPRPEPINSFLDR